MGIHISSAVESIATPWGAGDPAELARLLHVSGLVAYGLVLGAAVVTYFHWRMVSVNHGAGLDERLARWLTVGLTAAGVNGLLQMSLSDPVADGWAVVGQLSLVLLLCAAVAVADRVDLPGDPAVLCTLAAVAIPSAYGLVMLVTPPLVLGALGGAVLNLTAMLASLLLVWIVLGRTTVALRARRQLSAAVLLMSTGQCTANLDPRHTIPLLGAIAAYLFGAALLCSMTQQLLRRSVLQSRAEIELLQRSLAEAQEGLLEDRELLHEVGATLAGISTASRVMRRAGAVPVQRRQRMETMLAAELDRLERLMRRRAEGWSASEDEPLWLDDVIEPVVVSHQARGRLVSWQPCQQSALGNPDELAELCNILLENAARHGAGTTTLSVSAYDGGVEVVCADEGPGVPPEQRSRIFETEVKGSGSTGQGLGLGIARRLATARGGSLELVADRRRGATFVAMLPGKVVTGDQACHVA